MNWGVKLAVTLAVFVIGMVCVGIYMVTQNKDSLEEGDYYEKGLNYDDTYQRKQNLINDRMKPTLTWNGDTLHVEFNQDGNQGDFLFKRASNQDLDVKFPFQIEGSKFQLPLSTMERGSWTLSIQWASKGKDYLFQETLHLK